MVPTNRTLPIAALLFLSGMCALIYQTVWLREFRLIFGSSTAASAAVLGIFMGGLGLGSAWLGHRAERKTRPLLFYGNLELLISLAAAATPLLVWLVRQAYAATGGSVVMGSGMSTVVRLLLASLVLIVPTVLMGGTLPAMARAASSEEDRGRRSLALLYGCNTIGAVTGAALSTFFLVEMFGNRGALWLACGVNLLVALTARMMGRNREEIPVAEKDALAAEPGTAKGSGWLFVVVAAALVGFAFMVMELVWYRMLSPILGGSTFTFGLVLVVALLGIGLGGAAYSIRSQSRAATLGGFSATCVLEALFIAIPYALGDRIAMLALLLRPLEILGFSGQIFGWLIVAVIVVLPTSIIAGYQFPLLIGLLGQGRSGVASHTGTAYAANTLGAIVGSLAGGFGLLPLMSAPGVWKAVTVLLAVLALAAWLQTLRRVSFISALALPATAVAAVGLLMAQGPTAAWRHSGIGSGRADNVGRTWNEMRDFSNAMRRILVWEAEGVESSVGLVAQTSYAFVVNGKVDGNARSDAGTQVMSGLMGSILHHDPRKIMVIGLGTGSSAGWLGKVPGVEKVDVVEIEPSVVRVAEWCSPVNENVLENPKVKVHLGDAREVLLATPERYDVIFSEPSNPYRAGIASLFTQDFYRAIEERLAPGGIFVQWVQVYDIDGEAIRNVYATLGSIFPQVQTWSSQQGDFLLIATREPLRLDAGQLRQRIASEPYNRSMYNVWRIDSVEGFLARFVANEDLARWVSSRTEMVSTDDRNLLEFAFARSVGHAREFNLAEEIKSFAVQNGMDRPLDLEGEVDWTQVSIERLVACVTVPSNSLNIANTDAGLAPYLQFVRAFVASNYGAAADIIKSHNLEPKGVGLSEVFAHALAMAGDPAADAFIEDASLRRSADGEALRGLSHVKQARYAEGIDAILKAINAWQSDPWVHPRLVRDSFAALERGVSVSRDRPRAMAAFSVLGKPLAVEQLAENRHVRRLNIARATEEKIVNAQSLEAMKYFGENPIWTRPFLLKMAVAYRAANHPDATRMNQWLRELGNHEMVRFADALPRGEDPENEQRAPETTMRVEEENLRGAGSNHESSRGESGGGDSAAR